jgi:hypothetical protein
MCITQSYPSQFSKVAMESDLADAAPGSGGLKRILLTERYRLSYPIQWTRWQLEKFRIMPPSRFEAPGFELRKPNAGTAVSIDIPIGIPSLSPCITTTTYTKQDGYVVLLLRIILILKWSFWLRLAKVMKRWSRVWRSDPCLLYEYWTPVPLSLDSQPPYLSHISALSTNPVFGTARSMLRYCLGGLVLHRRLTSRCSYHAVIYK